MEADLHAIVSSVRLSTRQSLIVLLPRSGPSSHSQTLISSLLFIKPFAVSSTSTPLMSFTAISSRGTSWLMPTASSKSATSVSRGDTLLGEVPVPRLVPTRAS